MPRPLAALLVSLLGIPPLAASVRADEPTPECRRTPDAARLQVTLRPGATLEELVTWYAGLTCARVVYATDTACRAGGVVVLAPEAMTGAEARQLFLAALEAMGLEARARGKTLAIVDAAPGRPVRPGCLERLEGRAAGGEPRASSLEPDAARASADGPGALAPELAGRVRRIDELHTEVDRALVDALVADPAIAARAMRIVPAVQDGKAIGFKVYAIRPGSLPALLGLQNGDTVVALNGTAISSPDKALEVWARLATTPEWRLDLKRRGQAVTLVIRVR